jgi:CubicO group peptidase (beta-lactamase class C family)
MLRTASIATLAMAVSSVVSCSSPPDPPISQSLTRGYWHGSIGPHDFIYEFRASDGILSGETHQIENGHQRTVAEMTKVSFDGTIIEITYSALPPYRGEVDLETDRITGGHPNSGAYENLSLTRVDPSRWPMVAAKSPPTPGEPQYAWVQPVESNDGWKTGSPEDVGVEPAAIGRTVAAVISGDAGWIHSLLIVLTGKLVVEEYFHGWEADDLHRIASCTKSISSLLVGIAIDRGEIDGVEVPLLDFFPERRTNAGEGWDALRLDHLLTMSMGLDWTAHEADTFPPRGQDPLADVIARNVQTAPGTQFQYVSRNMNLLSGILLRATGSHADAFAAEHLFAPLGINSWHWENNKYEGHPDMTGTLKLRPRDMAKLGMLVLDKGLWEGRQVVSSDWIRESTSAKFHPSAEDEYGYLWWGFDDPPPGIDFASGIGSQFIVVIPAFDMVLVTTGANEYNNKHPAILGVIKEHLAPGLRRAS